MDFNGVWVAIVTSAGGVVVGVMTWLGSKSAASSKRDEAEIASRGDEWQKIIKAVNEHNDARVGALEKRVGHLELENEATKTKYWKAIYYGRAWRLHHPESVTLIEVPPEIIDDL